MFKTHKKNIFFHGYKDKERIYPHKQRMENLYYLRNRDGPKTKNNIVYEDNDKK